MKELAIFQKNREKNLYVNNRIGFCCFTGEQDGFERL